MRKISWHTYTAFMTPPPPKGLFQSASGELRYCISIIKGQFVV